MISLHVPAGLSFVDGSFSGARLLGRQRRRPRIRTSSARAGDLLYDVGGLVGTEVTLPVEGLHGA